MRKVVKKTKLKNIQSKLIVVITSLFVLGMLLISWQPNLTGHVTAASCLDEDGDNQLVAAKTTTTLASGVSEEFLDKCTEGKLTEYICDGSRATEKLYDCSCTDGYCSVNPSPAPAIEQPRRRS